MLSITVIMNYTLRLFIKSRIYLCFILFGAPSAILGQSIEEKLIVKIAHIEEFIDRFNFEEGSYFNNYVKSEYGDKAITREIVLESMFNQRNGLQKEELSYNFINTVCTSGRPSTLDFHDPMWYATVPLTLHTKEKDYNAILTLEIQLNEDSSTEWVIAGAQSSILPKPEEEVNFFIKPSSHATHFPELLELSKSSARLQEVISERHSNSALKLFDKLLSTNIVTSISISKDIKYHFLQISGWVFQVSYYNDNESLNTGWLISDLKKVSSLEMRKYERDVLGIR
jgi:hypothetical protein